MTLKEEAMKEIQQTILIVDDAPANIEVLSAAIGDSYEILFATDGREAIRLAFEVIPDLILLDVLMPGMGGYDVCRSLKNNPALRDIPVIFITALDQEDQETKGLELGAVDYITKPFYPAIVRLRVKNHLELKHQRDMLTVKNAELQDAMAKIKTLSGFIPICASCKKVRDDSGYWNQLEAYISAHSDAEFSHGLCPECMKRLYPDYCDDI